MASEYNRAITADEIIARLGLAPLPGEGGYYVESYRSPIAYGESRSLATAIYYLLTPDTFSEQAPYRQWVLTFPWELRFRLSIDKHFLSDMLKSFLRVLFAWQRRSQPVARHGEPPPTGPDRWSGGTLYPQSSRKVARAINAASGRRPVVILANLSGFDGSPESLRQWQLEYGAEIGRSVVNFRGRIVFAVVSRYHGGAYVVFSRTLNPGLVALAVEGSYASVIGGAPAAAVVFSREVDHLTQARGGGDEVRAQVTAELANRFDTIHTIERAKDVGSIDDAIPAARLRPRIIEALMS